MAGSINYDGYIEYEAEKIGRDSSISNIVKLVVEATNTKAPIARLADKISGKFVPAIFAISIIALIINLIVTGSLEKAMIALVSVLVVACPCALGLATPLAMVVSIGRASKLGILVKSSESLETVNKIDTIVFDKTGTLTKGKMTIVDGKYDDETLKILQSLEANSNHPIAKSIVALANEKYDVSNFEDVAGKGIKGEIENKTYYAGNSKFVEEMNVENKFKSFEEEYSKKGESIVYLFTENEVLAIFGLADEIKEESKMLVRKLKEENKRVIMLTGDNKVTANAIAKELGIEEVISNVTPKQKKEEIEKLNKNNSCLMVGDGVNDSPALKSATIGVSVQNGTDISQDSADIILLKDDINILVDLIHIGRKTIKIIKENLFWALFYNILMIPLAMGIFKISLNPMIASLAMTLSSLTVVLNSLRLRY